MSVTWKKVWSDVWRNKVRTLLAVLSIAAGLYAVGVMFGMVDQLNTTLDASHQAVKPPHLTISLERPVDRDVILSVRQVPGVEDVQPFNEVTVRYKLNPQSDWKQGVVYMLDDFDRQTYQLIQLRQGRWPRKDDIGAERMAAQFYNLNLGDSITFKIGKVEKTLPISAKIRHPYVPPPQFQDLAFFFVDGEGLERFGIPQGQFNQLFACVTPYSTAHAKEVATAIKDHLGKQNVSIRNILYQEPDKHWARVMMDSILLVMKTLASISLLMSTVLVYNTIAALISQQIHQIGILKAVGARLVTILRIYLSIALIYGLLAFIIACPLSAIVAFGMSRWWLNLYNIDYEVFQISGQATLIQALAALAVPLLAGLIPTLQGARITVQQALASYGLGNDFGSSWLDRAVEHVGRKLLPSRYATALGNMFRRKGRLFLTQVTLITAGATFLMVMSLSASIQMTLDRLFERQQYDTTMEFTQSQRIDRVVEMAQSVEGVEKAEVWFSHSASILTRGQLVKEAGLSTNVQGVPTDSDFYMPLIVAGRWLRPGDGRAAVVSYETAKNNNIRVGDVIILNLGELGKDEWQVVGLHEPVFNSAYSIDTVYAPQDALHEATKKNNQGRALYVRTRAHDRASVNAVTAQLKDLFEGRNLKISEAQTQYDVRQTDEFSFGTTVTFFLALAVMVAVVGGIALMGALSISVVERTKEIGVMRAVGARSRTIMGLYVMEGALQGVLSWLMAVPLSFLISQPASEALGRALMNTNLDYTYDWQAIVTWLAMVMAISALASILPARNAMRVSVRASLAYA